MIAPPVPTTAAAPDRNSSKSTVFARQVQVLGYGWNGLTLGDVHRILKRLDDVRACVPSPANLLRIEAALGIVSCFFTGRRLNYLAHLQWTSVKRWSELQAVPLGLVRCAESWGWHLPSGQAGRLKSASAGNTFPLWLPAPKLVSDLAQLSLNARGKLRSCETPLFGSKPDDLVAAARDMLREDSGDVRRAGTTLEAVERWFFEEVRRIAGGDAGLGQVITARSDITSKTTSYYTECDQEAVEDAWWEVFRTITGEPRRWAPDPALRKQRYGSPNVPPASVMQSLAASQRAAIVSAPDNQGRHNAMTLYSITLFSVGLALRPADRPVLRTHGIDPSTGFLTIEDDRRRDPFMVRLSWAAPVVRSQFDHYREHLRETASTCLAARYLLEGCSSAHLPIFLYEEGQARPKVLFDVMTQICKGQRELKQKNFARHYMRTQLLGRCSSETLQAFFGHWNSGTEPFGIGSGLDPLLYRADLERVLPSVLADAGWTPQASAR